MNRIHIIICYFERMEEYIPSICVILREMMKCFINMVRRRRHGGGGGGMT